MEYYGERWIAMDSDRYSWIAMDRDGYQWIAMDSDEYIITHNG